MIKVGIDTLAIYTSQYAIHLKTLAEARNVEPNKFEVGLGQRVMAFPCPGEDVITLGANAAQEALQGIDLNEIDLLIFATESGIDQSKAGALYLHGLLGLPPRCRAIELKQACYAGTAGLQLAMPYLRENPHKKVLLIAADIARYGLQTSGESSQGCGACAMVLAAEPRVLAIESEFGVVSENVMDFWRPNYLTEALVDGKYSSKLYLQMLEASYRQYQDISQRDFQDHAYFCYHTPVPRLVEKAHQHLLKLTGQQDISVETWMKQISASLVYGRNIGNSYSASLYVAFASLLDFAKEDLAHRRIGFYSYGSGCVAEFFSGIIQPSYKKALHTNFHADLLANRIFLSYDEYEKFYNFKYVEDGTLQEIPEYKTGSFRLSKINQHKRIYSSLNAQPNITNLTNLHEKTQTRRLRNQETATEVIKVFAPGKLILSGEHAVVYEHPALAMAINRYVTATVTHESSPQVSFDLSDLAHHSRLSLNALRHLKERIKRKYHRFIHGDFSIRDVLQKPFELVQFTLSVLADSLHQTLPHGVKVHLQSDIPMGCGLGSSAATILSVMHAVSTYLRQPISDETIFKLALEAENMQHGYSSGLDLRVAEKGGCLYIDQGQIQSRELPDLHLYLVNTGTPVSTTGQCVEKVAPFFKDQKIGEEFAAITRAMDTALQKKSWSDMQEAIRLNHRLLVKIGVVPEKVQQFVSELEAIQCAAKICGAGAVVGQQAGAVLVAGEEKTGIAALSTRFGFNVIPIAGDLRGVHAA